MIKEQAAVLLEQNGILNIDWNALTVVSPHGLVVPL